MGYPLQRGLAAHVRHAALAGRWAQQPFDADYLETPVLPENATLFRQEPFKPHEGWSASLQTLRETLLAYQHETNANQKLDNLEIFAGALRSFKQQNLAASPVWNHYYFAALEKWEKETEERLAILRADVTPIVRNPYHSGDALHPDKNRRVFLGREDLRDQLIHAIRSAGQMPMFLFQGQRRVGKTSLLNFLPEILGEGFRVGRFDLQGADDFPDVPGWLAAIRRKTAAAFHLESQQEVANVVPPSEGQGTGAWLSAWQDLENWLLKLPAGKRLVLAFDEYESLHLSAFRFDPIQAERLLGAMRSFSQRHNQVVFLFAGASYFFELTEPDWGKFFVQSVTLPVDYLSEADTLRLVTSPAPGFPIVYGEGVPAKIYALTQGHPALSQLICRELVELANETKRKELNGEDLALVLRKKVMLEDTHPLNRFWNEFCAEPAMKEAVRAIVRRQPVSDQECLKRLLRHRFVVQGEGGYRLRAPIFEEWVEKFDLAFQA
ncbi:MAG: ATP-binding protein [Saprospiraceae bacterium]|nr:MAG: ATP-binding protein [Saprospiraceae bacterium]